jgi:hypothetical protein
VQQKRKRVTAEQRIEHSIQKFGDADHSKERKLKEAKHVRKINK